MIQIQSKIRVRKSVYNPSIEVKSVIGKEGVVIKSLGIREEVIGDFKVSRNWYLVKFGNQIIELNEDIFDKRHLKIDKYKP